MDSSRKAFIAAVVAAVFAAGAGAASAQPRGDHGHGRPDGGRFERMRHDDGPRDRHGAQGHRNGGHDRRFGAHAYRHAPPQWHGGPQHWHGQAAHRHAGGRGAGPRHDLYVGRPLPAYYRTPHYVVRDWHAHRLAPPPRGYHWVQAGTDYLMIAVGTGLIAQVVLGW